MVKKIVLSAVITTAILVSCKKLKAPEPVVVESNCSDTVSYNNFIAQEIINLSCNTSGCHADGAGGYNWDNHQIVADNADLIYEVISHAPGAKAMPLGGPKLSDSLIAQFECWIEQGKLDN